MARVAFIRTAAFLGLSLLSFTAARPDGAPASACESMRPSHAGTQPQAGQAPYTVTANASTFINGRPIAVRIEGPDYQGVLLQARADGSTTPLGSWINPPPNTRILECGNNPSGAVTHANTTPKTKNTTYTWMPPAANCPNAIMFVATAAESFSTYYIDLKSDALQKDPAATCGSSGTVTSSSNTTQLPERLATMKLATTTSSVSTETPRTWVSSLLLLLPGHLFLALLYLC